MTMDSISLWKTVHVMMLINTQGLKIPEKILNIVHLKQFLLG